MFSWLGYFSTWQMKWCLSDVWFNFLFIFCFKLLINKSYFTAFTKYFKSPSWLVTKNFELVVALLLLWLPPDAYFNLLYLLANVYRISLLYYSLCAINAWPFSFYRFLHLKQTICHFCAFISSTIDLKLFLFCAWIGHG